MTTSGDDGAVPESVPAMPLLETSDTAPLPVRDAQPDPLGRVRDWTQPNTTSTIRTASRRHVHRDRWYDVPGLLILAILVPGLVILSGAYVVLFTLIHGTVPW